MNEVPRALVGGVEWLLSLACGLIIANLYYGQPLAALIGASLHMAPGSIGLLVTLPLSGYGVGLLTLVPLGDLFENRRLVLLLVALEAVALAAISVIGNATLFLGVAFLVGLVASSVQVLVPYVTYLVPESRRGAAIGRVVSGVMLGIMLARPVASIVAHHFSWEAIYRLSAISMVLLLVVLRVALPKRRPEGALSYRGLLASMGRLFLTVGLLRRRGFYHACMFGAFSVFWTAVPLWLSGPRFGLTQSGIAAVALAGVAGAVAPPIAGRLADRGLARIGTGAAMVLAVLAFALTVLVRGHGLASVCMVAVAAVLLDFAVSANLVFSQRAIYALGTRERSRLNGLFFATFFVGGAVGSAFGGWAYSMLGWGGVAALGAFLPLLSFGFFLRESLVPAQPADVALKSPLP